MTSFLPTPEQAAIVAQANSPDSLMIQAFAGCAKTTSLVLLAQALPATPALALVFNKKNKDEMEKKFPKHFTVKTLNGLGHSAWGKAIGKGLTLEDKKIGQIVSQILREFRPKALPDDWDYVRQMVSSAMNVGLVPSNFAAKGLVPDTQESWKDLAEERFGVYDPDLCSYAHQALCVCIKQSLQGLICFDDQIYMSALFGGVFPKFPIVMVDEAQDLSPLNHLQLAKCTPTAGRLIVVGDVHQAIYGFRGAHTSSMAQIRKLKPQWVDLLLPETFRVPTLLVERQHGHVPNFRAHKDNYPGFFHNIRKPQDSTDDFSWDWNDVQRVRVAHECTSVAILCRNNAPLLTCAFRLIRQGVGVMMMGRDIGKSLVTLTKKLIPQAQTPITECATLITQWIDKEVALAMANGKEDKADAAHDRGYCLLAVIDSAPQINNREDLINALERLFSKTSEIVQLSTGHRFKGMEADLVIHLDPWRVPSKYAEPGTAQFQQEMNLKYVIETRSKRALLYANSEELRK
jgi:DNA helicase II / ATP-dependent DNA helicase PcrA